MKKFLSNYKSTIILFVAIIIGAIVGFIMKEDAVILKPLGDIFLNLMFVVIVPLIFATITTSIAKMKQPKRLGKVMGGIFSVIIITSIIAVLVGVLSVFFIDLIDVKDKEAIKASIETVEESDTEEEVKELTGLERLASMITVNDFPKLLSKDNIIAILIFSIMFGIAMNMAGEKANKLTETIESLSEVIMNVIKMIMYYAPIGLGAYFASMVGTMGETIVYGYLKTFIIYTVVCILYYVIVYTIYAFIAGGKKAVIAYWKNVFAPTATAIATCSSSAAIPVNITAVKNMGVSDDISDTMIPIGTNFHKDGSIIGSVFKIMFLVCLYGATPSIGLVLGTALLSTLLISSIPMGGGAISEIMIITMMGFNPASLLMLTTIAAIIDAPATALNVVGNTSSSLLTARIVDGKDWMNKNKNEEIESPEETVTT